MKDKLLENINELFDSYNLVGGNSKKNIDKMKQMMPDITEEDVKEVLDYLEGFYRYCSKYGDKLADKYKAPCLPWNDEAEKDIKEYVLLCQEKYPEIDEEHIRELFSTICWLANR
ncbi:MAG: hypothetical protein IJF03_05275 [Lachnospiraceae bacterium]|nr:hypothetical protein [Lachnospiraceae bacterium]